MPAAAPIRSIVDVTSDSVPLEDDATVGSSTARRRCERLSNRWSLTTTRSGFSVMIQLEIGLEHRADRRQRQDLRRVAAELRHGDDTIAEPEREQRLGDAR